MPTQLEYGTQRASCIKELQKKMYRGHFNYYTALKVATQTKRLMAVLQQQQTRQISQRK